MHCVRMAAQQGVLTAVPAKARFGLGSLKHRCTALEQGALILWSQSQCKAEAPELPAAGVIHAPASLSMTLHMSMYLSTATACGSSSALNCSKASKK